MSVLMVCCGPHLPLAFPFVCGPGGEDHKKPSKQTCVPCGTKIALQFAILENPTLKMAAFDPIVDTNSALDTEYYNEGGFFCISIAN